MRSMAGLAVPPFEIFFWGGAKPMKRVLDFSMEIKGQGSGRSYIRLYTRSVSLNNFVPFVWEKY